MPDESGSDSTVATAACRACAAGDCQTCLNVYDDTIPCDCNHTPAVAPYPPICERPTVNGPCGRVIVEGECQRLRHADDSAVTGIHKDPTTGGSA